MARAEPDVLSLRHWQGEDAFCCVRM